MEEIICDDVNNEVLMSGYKGWIATSLVYDFVEKRIFFCIFMFTSIVSIKYPEFFIAFGLVRLLKRLMDVFKD